VYARNEIDVTRSAHPIAAHPRVPLPSGPTLHAARPDAGYALSILAFGRRQGSGMGMGGLAIMLWLMMFKPF